MRLPWRVAGLVVAAALMAGKVQAQSRNRLAPQEIVLRADSMNERALTQLAERLLREERYAAADSAVRRALLIEPLYGPAHDVLASLLLARDEELQEALERDRLTPEQQAALDEARTSRRLSFLIDPTGADGDLPGFIRLPEGADREPTAEELAELGPGGLLFRGMFLARRRHIVVALKYLEELLRQLDAMQDSVPTSLELPLLANDVRYVVATLYRETGRTHLATPMLQEAATADMGMFMAHVRLADIHERNGAWNAAVVERRRAIESGPDISTLVYQLGATLARAGRLAEADSVLSQSEQMNPLNARIPRMLGMVRQARADTAGAIAAYTRFLAIKHSGMVADQVHAGIALQQLRGTGSTGSPAE